MHELFARTYRPFLYQYVTFFKKSRFLFFFFFQVQVGFISNRKKSRGKNFYRRKILSLRRVVPKRRRKTFTITNYTFVAASFSFFFFFCFFLFFNNLLHKFGDKWESVEKQIRVCMHMHETSKLTSQPYGTSQSQRARHTSSDTIAILSKHVLSSLF